MPEGTTPIAHLRALTEAGARDVRYPQGVPAAVRLQLERELALVEELRYEAFFLTVHDIVRFARSRGILCQGRGSAANSAVCYCLGITEVDPTQTVLLFERFISRERNEPPDIDVDFEHERREEVIQYIYAKYGTHRTALAAALATYRTRGAVRDVGKALGLDAQVVDAVAKSCQWFDDRQRMVERFVEIGLDPASPVTKRWLELTATLHGFPRHLSQHSGGFVIARDKLSRLVPIETAAMEDRRVIQWDKDDLESLGLLKVDVLALGMLTALHRSLDLYNRWNGTAWTLQHIPREDPATYEMICRADTVGVFQIESRAQQSMLPRLRPQRFYDLVIEVAIVRPGPIQGGMVHPYLRRRQGLEPAASPKPELDVALARTLGVPIFQEQVMQICMIAAGFSGGEADELRRAMAAWKRKGGVHRFERRIFEGMAARGYPPEFAEGIFQQILGFGEYGFPESHAYSFAILAYLSSWLKCHEPAVFLAAMLNSQPMGFYGPSQLVQDARRHGVEVRPVDVTASDWDCTLEPAFPSSPARGRGSGEGAASAGHGSDMRNAAPSPQPSPASGRGSPAVRLGLRMVQSFPQASAERLVKARAERPFAHIEDLARRAGLPPARAPGAGARRRPRRAGRPPPAADLGRSGPGSAAGAAGRRAGRRSRTRPARRPRGRADPVRLRLARPHVAAPPGGAAASAPEPPRLAQRRRAGGPARRAIGLGLRHRHHAPAAGHRQRHHLRHAGGRDRLGERDRLAPCAGAAAPGAAGVAPAGGGRPVADARRRVAPGGPPAGGHDALARSARHQRPQLSLMAIIPGSLLSTLFGDQ